MSWSLGLRQFLADFLVSGYQLDKLSLTRRPDALTFDYLYSFAYGPRAIADVTEGIVARAWYVRADGGAVYIARANDAGTAWEAESVLFTYSGAPILEIDLAFEQAGRAVVVAERGTGSGGSSEVWLYWYDPTLLPTADFVFENKGAGTCPRTLLDDVANTQDADVQVVYLKPGTGLVRLEQRDRYATEYGSPLADVTNRYIEDFVVTVARRLRVEGSLHDPGTGTYSRWVLESLLYPVYLDADALGLGAEFQSAMLEVVLLLSELDEDSVALTASFVSAVLADTVIVHNLYDIDALDLTASFVSAVLLVTVLVHDLYDIDSLDLTASFISAVLLITVIVHELYDIDSLDLTATFQSAVLEAA